MDVGFFVRLFIFLNSRVIFLWKTKCNCVCLYTYISVHMCVHVCGWRSEDSFQELGFSPSTLLGLEIKLRLSGLEQVLLPMEPSCQHDFGGFSSYYFLTVARKPKWDCRAPVGYLTGLQLIRSQGFRKVEYFYIKHG